jgi:hypothetical protein
MVVNVPFRAEIEEEYANKVIKLIHSNILKSEIGSSFMAHFPAISSNRKSFVT